MEYSFISPLTVKPNIERKTYRKDSFTTQVVNEFVDSGVQHAELKNTEGYKSPASFARALGRTIKHLGFDEVVRAYSGNGKVYLSVPEAEA